MIIVSRVKVQSGAVELRIVPGESGDWRWSIQMTGGRSLERGTSSSKTAAEEDVERAFEERLQRAGLFRQFPRAFQWTEKLA